MSDQKLRQLERAWKANPWEREALWRYCERQGLSHCESGLHDVVLSNTKPGFLWCSACRQDVVLPWVAQSLHDRIFAAAAKITPIPPLTPLTLNHGRLLDQTSEFRARSPIHDLVARETLGIPHGFSGTRLE